MVRSGNIKIFYTVSVLFVILLVLAVAGCGSPGDMGSENAGSEDTDGEIVEVLRVAFVPAEDLDAMIEAFGPAQKYLERETGVTIEMYRATDYTAVVEAMRAGKVDMAFFGPFSYILAAERANAKAIVAGGTAEGVLGVYHSIIITHKDSGIKTIEDVKARSNELTVSFVDPASTSGHLIPRGFMESIGISVDNDFKEIIFVGGHDASILAVHARQVDVGATWEGPYNRAVDGGLVDKDDVFVIWKSEGIPRSPVAVRGDLDSDLVNKLQQAFLDMPEKDPAAMEQLEAAWEGNESYVKVTDSDYEFVLRIAEGLGKI